MNISNNKILITGGASSIGLGLTEHFVKEGNTVIVCGRCPSALKEVSSSFPQVITKHGDDLGKIVNKGKVDVEVFAEVENEPPKSSGVLKPKDKDQFYIGKNTTAIFKNLGAKNAMLGIILSGETGLSISYKDNQK